MTPAECQCHQARDRHKQSLNISGTAQHGAGLVIFATWHLLAVPNPTSTPLPQGPIPSSQGKSSSSATNAGLTLLDGFETCPTSPP